MTREHEHSHTPRATLSTEELDRKIEKRLRHLEDDLKKHGIHIVCGAEQEFFTQEELRGSKERGPWPVYEDINLKKLKKKLGELGLPLLEHVYQENHYAQLLEVVLGTQKDVAQSLHAEDSSYHPSVELAQAVMKLRKILPEALKDLSQDMRASFDAMPPYNDKASAGLHINVSAFNPEGQNVFRDPQSNAFSDLAKHSADRLLTLQKEGLALYVPNRESYKRFQKVAHAPSTFVAAVDNKRSASLALRRDKRDDDSKDNHRIEDRLSPADADPHIAILAAVGAIHRTIMDQYAHPPIHAAEGEPIVSNLLTAQKEAQRSFEKSELWKKVAGDDLYNDLITYSRSRATRETGRV